MSPLKAEMSQHTKDDTERLDWSAIGLLAITGAVIAGAVWIVAYMEPQYQKRLIETECAIAVAERTMQQAGYALETQRMPPETMYRPVTIEGRSWYGRLQTIECKRY